MQRQHYVLSGFVALGLVTGCGDSDKSIALAELPPKLAQALCTA